MLSDCLMKENGVLNVIQGVLDVGGGVSADESQKIVETQMTEVKFVLSCLALQHIYVIIF